MVTLCYIFLRLRSWYWRLPCYLGRHAWSTWELDEDRRWFRVCCSCLDKEVGGLLDHDEGTDGDR